MSEESVRKVENRSSHVKIASNDTKLKDALAAEYWQ